MKFSYLDYEYSNYKGSQKMSYSDYDVMRLRENLQLAKEKLVELSEKLKELSEGAVPFGYIINSYRLVEDGEAKQVALIAADNKLFEVNAPKSLKLVPGDVVRLSPITGQILSKAQEAPLYGETCTVLRLIDQNSCIVQYSSSERVITIGQIKDLKIGDRVILDPVGIVALKRIPAEKQYVPQEVINTTWADIGGQDQAIKQMREAIELPITHAEVFKRFGRKPAKGLLLYGPPGCGKTLLAKAAANAIQKLHKKTSENSFLYVKGPEILSQWVGVAEATIRSLFSKAKQYKKETGYPAVIFIDEADAILSKRGSGISSDIDKTIVPQFLSEMDGLEDSGAFLILATNRSDMLDPAVVREGRIDRKVKINRPTAETAPEVFKIHLKEKLVDGQINSLAKRASQALFSEEHMLYELKVGEETVNYTLGNLVNGAMIANVVDQALSIAMERELSTKESDYGITAEDLEEAVSHVFKQQLDLNHEDDLKDFISSQKETVTSLKKRKS